MTCRGLVDARPQSGKWRFCAAKVPLSQCQSAAFGKQKWHFRQALNLNIQQQENMKRTIYLMLAILLAALPAGATDNNQQQKEKKKEHTVGVYGNVKDSFTKADLKAFVTLMRDDSTVIDTATTQGWSRHLSYNIRIPSRAGRYIVKAEAEGYETATLNHTIKYIARNKYIEFPSLLLKKKANKEVTLDDVVVTATKVKFAYRGDTLVYNASAFNVPEGSMLDAIVRQLPGAEIKANGDIYVNGKKIDYLLLNGKDFFKGKNQIMLDNLPYYTVSDLKVYDRSTDKSRLMGKEVEKKDFVMDVGLKREYKRGYIANAEAAGGTEDRYIARLFGLYYTDRTRLSAFGNVNNVNETRRPGREGDWSPDNSPQGQKTTRQAGIDFRTESKSGNVIERAEATMQWESLHDVSRTATENFSSAGNIFSRSTADSRNSAHNFTVYNNLQIQGKTGLYIDTNIDYSGNKSRSSSRSATYSAEPNLPGGIKGTVDSTFTENVQGTLRDIITNRSLGRTRSKTSSLNLFNNIMAWHKLPWGDRIELSLNNVYTRAKPSESFALSRNEYFKTGGKDLRDIYSDNNNNAYNFSASLKYGLEIPHTKWTVYMGPKYEQDYKSYNDMRYRLDELGDEWASNPETMFATLPSNGLLLDNVLDGKTSRRYNIMKRNGGGQLMIVRSGNNSSLQATLDVSEERERINYHSTAIDTTATRRRVKIAPSIFFYKYADKLFTYLHYYISSKRPDFASVMPYTDDSNTLAIRTNNTKLKNSLTQHYDINIRISGLKNEQYIGFFATGNFYHNSVGTRVNYNTQTGAYTYTSENICGGGNWDFWTTTSYGTALDKKRLFRLDYKLWINGLRRNEFDIAYDNNAPTLCHTLNTELGNSLYIRFQKKKLSVNVGGKIEWKHTTSSRANFETINAYDFEYGGNLTYTLPLGITLSTDMKEYCRRGYGEKSFNTSDLVWNASLARSFCKGKLTLTAEAFDILHNLSSTKYNVEVQSKSEIWRNSLPSYTMVHLAYKFNKMPKSKDK